MAEAALDQCWPQNLRDVWGCYSDAVEKYLVDKFERGRKNKDYYEQQLEHTRKMAKTVILGWWWTEKYGGGEMREPSNYPKRFAEWLLEQYLESTKLAEGDNRCSGPRS